MKGIFQKILSGQWLRIALAAIILIVGMAPIGLPILSDSSRNVRAGREMRGQARAQRLHSRISGVTNRARARAWSAAMTVERPGIVWRRSPARSRNPGGAR